MDFESDIVKRKRYYRLAGISASIYVLRNNIPSVQDPIVTITTQRDLAKQLLSQYEETGEDEVLDEALGLLRHITSPDGARSGLQASIHQMLASAIVWDYDRTGTANLQEAFDLVQSNQSYTSYMKQAPISFIIMKSKVLVRMSESNFADNVFQMEMDRALESLHRCFEEIQITGVQHAECCSMIAGLLLRQFKFEQKVETIESAVLYARKAVQSASSFPTILHAYLYRLGNILHCRYQAYRSTLQDLDEAIDLFQKCHESVFEAVPSYVRSGLGLALLTRFEETGNASSLDESINLFLTSMNTYPDHCSYSFYARNWLMRALMRKFERHGAAVDLDEAISTARHCQEIKCPEWLLGMSFFILCDLRNVQNEAQRDHKVHYDSEYIREELAATRKLLQLHPPGTFLHFQVRWYHARALYKQGDLTGSAPDLKEASGHCHAALDSGTCQGFDLVEVNATLADVLYTWSRITGDLDMIGQAVHYREIAMELTEKVRPFYSVLCTRLASDLNARFILARNPSDLTRCMDTYSEAVAHSYSSIGNRLRYGYRWIEAAKASHNTTALSLAYTSVLQLLPRHAYRAGDVRSRLDELRSTSRLATDAALHEISRGDLNLAVEHLEHGRAIFWNCITQMRNPFDQLPNALAERIRFVSHRINAETFIVTSRISEKEVSRLRVLVEEFESLMEQARSLPGLEHFLLPYPFSQLRHAASEGPVVTLLSGDHSSCAVAVLPGKESATFICLPNAHPNHLKQWFSRLRAVQNAVRSCSDESGEEMTMKSQRLGVVKHKQPKSHKHDDGRLRSLLAELWTDVVHPILQALRLTVSLFCVLFGIHNDQTQDRTNGPRSRLWWCPTGPFVFFPLHAAGIYALPANRRDVCVSDFVISSYTPTLGALLDARERPNAMLAEGSRILLVSQSNAPGLASLPMVSDEIARVTSIYGRKRVVSFGSAPSSMPPLDQSAILEPTASIENISSALPDASVVHFACHAHQKRNDPLSSGFSLEDGLLTVYDIARVKVPRALFAFLSACDSAAGDEELPDEMVHLAGTMLFSGFRSVVGTMWSVIMDFSEICPHR
jgi:tetratricopeptide (TPR) repeat protein